jgi:hypothetical protein
VKRHYAIGLGALAVALVVGTVVWLAPRKLHELPERMDLPPAARRAVHSRMSGHGQELSVLSERVVLLEFEGAAEMAEHVRSNARLSRPLSGDATELNARLPEQFFALQDELVQRADVLAAAARRHNAEAVADAYAGLMRTCVRCHAAYLAR